MSTPALQIVALVLASAATLPAQTPSSSPSTGSLPASSGLSVPPAPKAVTPYINRNLIFLDPAHGGTDPGAHLANNVLEKDITLALANRIRALLAGNSLGVQMAREADGPAASSGDSGQPSPGNQAATPDSRAGAANHTHPVACILLHATSSGNGVHIVTSALDPVQPDPNAPPVRVLPWETAQTDSLPQSLRLAGEIATAVSRANLPVHLSRASVKPIDSLTCPAVAIEIAPLVSGPTQVSDPTYQQRLAEAVATALLFWRSHADPAPTSASPAAKSQTSATPGAQP